MVFKPISADLLRKAAEDAEKRDQYGIIIWPSEVKWRSLHRFVDANSPLVPEIAMYLQSHTKCWVSFVKGRVSPAQSEGYSLVIPTHCILTRKDYCRKILQDCPPNVGVPISMFPSMHLSAIHLNPSLS